MNNNISKIFIIILLFGISFGLNTRIYFVFAETVDQLNQQISDTQKNLKNLEAEALQIQKELEKTGTAKASLKKELSLINSRRKSLENNISQTKSKINILDNEIEKTEDEINIKNNTITEQSYFLGSLLRRVEQKEDFSLLESILSSQSLSLFFKNRDTYLNLQDPILKNTYLLKENKKSLFHSKEKLVNKQGDLVQEKEKYNDQKIIVAQQEQEKNIFLKKTKNKESLYQKNLANTKKAIADLDREIRSYESKLKFILDKNSLPTKGSGVLDWPLSKNDIYVTQRFGKTTSSGILYTSGSHSGTDFRAAIGTPIYAVADGIIRGTGDTDTACRGISFGKWILIEHDLGLSTAYGHLSKIKTSKGKSVKKGDLIGYSGNTGHTTGPHLHLSVYATYGNGGEKVVKIKSYNSWTCPGNILTRPSAPTGAYLNPIDYLPPLARNRFKHPRL